MKNPPVTMNPASRLRLRERRGDATVIGGTVSVGECFALILMLVLSLSTAARLGQSTDGQPRAGATDDSDLAHQECLLNTETPRAMSTGRRIHFEKSGHRHDPMFAQTA
jgi:hypothetical protein